MLDLGLCAILTFAYNMCKTGEYAVFKKLISFASAAFVLVLAHSANAVEQLKVLMIGNSFSVCVLKQMPQCAASAGKTLDLASLDIGGCPLERHWNNVENSGDPNFKPYGFTYNYASVKNAGDAPVAKLGRKTNIPQALAADKWDVVTIQQASAKSPFAETYEPFASKLIDTIRKLAPQAEIVIQQTWSYSAYATERLAKFKMTPDTMYDNLEAAYSKLAANHKLRIIPTGCAIQLYRKKRPVKYGKILSRGEIAAMKQPDLVDFCDDAVGSSSWRKAGAKSKTPGVTKLVVDTAHLNREGQYLQACTWLAALYGCDVTKLAYAPEWLSADKAKLMRSCAAEAVAQYSSNGETSGLDGWTPKFYQGLEADGEVVFEPLGYCGRAPAITLKWTSGMPKFGVAKGFKSKLDGVVDWTVSANVKCAEKARATVAMEFFNRKGVSLGVKTGPLRTMREWTRITWKFTSPRAAARASVHLLSLSEAPVSFALVDVSDSQGIDKNEIPFAMKIVPAEWNRDWNGGKTRMMNFSDAPLPMTVLLKGEKKALKSPSFEIDLPEELEIKSAFCPLDQAYGKEIPSSVSSFETNGMRFARVRFENLRCIANLMTKFNIDTGIGIVLVVGPKVGGEKISKTFPIVCRIASGGEVADVRPVEMEFRPLPAGLKISKNFMAMGWRSGDRCFTDDNVLLEALRAYEAAGIRMFRLSKKEGALHERIENIRKVLDKRPLPYVFAVGLGDVWNSSVAKINKKSLAEIGGRLSVTSNKNSHHKKKICPQFFTTSKEFHKHLEDNVILPMLKTCGVKDGDWVTLDMEPWQSGTYCYCEDCRKAFAEFAKLDQVPAMEQISTMKDVWAEFRVRHSAKSVELIAEMVRRYNPALKVIDYDYIIEYGNPESRTAFIRGCAKDSLLNEQWLDGHLCSYYHCIGRRSFKAIKNNVRHLKKAYYPMAGLSGFSTWVRPGEVLNPRQIRQFALAAFVNGCPGYAFYYGTGFDGEVLLAMMEAQDIAARYEDLPWGKIDGKTKVEGPEDQIAYSSTVRPDGSEVVAVFNYDGNYPVKVTIGGREHEVGPYGVEFVEVK